MNSWTFRLILLNVVCFALTFNSEAMLNAMALIAAYIAVRPWTIVTYMFMHASITHILFNMLGLFFFGPRVEAQLGSGKFLGLYFVSGFMGAAFSFLFTPYTAIVGASGAIFGVFLAFGYFWPRERIYIWGIVPIEARVMVVLMTVLTLFGGCGIGASDIAHFTHLGGFVGAYVFLKLDERRTARRLSMSTPQPSVPSKESLDRWEKIDREKLHEVNRGELDRIREKIRTEGVSSLTEQERVFLDRFSENMS
jgi:membrane associated rhomboid family serine protease